MQSIAAGIGSALKVFNLLAYVKLRHSSVGKAMAFQLANADNGSNPLVTLPQMSSTP